MCLLSGIHLPPSFASPYLHMPALTYTTPSSTFLKMFTAYN